MMNRPPNHYKTLGIDRGAPSDAVRSAYRRLAQKYHPDRYEGRGDSAQTMASINQAYEVLSDAQSRARYDASISPAPTSGPAGLSRAGVSALESKRPWLLLWVVVSLTVLALGWVAFRTMFPAAVAVAPACCRPPGPGEIASHDDQSAVTPRQEAEIGI